MFKNLPAMWLVSIFSLSGIAAAQTPAPASPVPDAAPASTLIYRSAFEDYKPYTDDKMTSWKAANDDVARIGGWREYAKQAQQPENTPATKAGEVKPKAKP